MGRRRISAEVKMAVVLEGLRGETRIADICRKYGIAESAYYKWRGRFLEGGRRGLEQGSGTSEADKLKNKIKELQRIVGKQRVEIEILKEHSIARENKYRIAKELRCEGYKVTDICRCLGVSRSSYYRNRKSQNYASKRTSSKPRDDEADLLLYIKELKMQYPFWGYRRIWAYLRYRQDIHINKKRVYRLMRENNLLCSVRRRKVNRTSNNGKKPKTE